MYVQYYVLFKDKNLENTQKLLVFQDFWTFLGSSQQWEISTETDFWVIRNLILTMTTFKSIQNILVIFQTGIDSCGSAARPITLQS